jgi:hypothetical protein
VRDTIGATHEHRGVALHALARDLQGLQRFAVEGDEEILPEDQVDLGRVEFLGTRVVDRMHHDVEILVVLLDLRQR